MANLVGCKECGHHVSRHAKTCPNCGVSKPAVKPATAGETFGGLLILIVLGAALYTCTYETPEEKAAAAAREAAERAEQRKAGFHCLSDWDGSHRGVVTYVKERLRDPDSFQHVETRITPVDASGAHRLIMQYRANNGFGGKTLGTAVATIKSANCSATITAVD